MNITIGSIVAILVAGILIRFATKFLIKLFGWLILIGAGVYALYHFGIGPFKQNPISVATWEEEYCIQPSDQATCDCIVMPIKADLEARFTPYELSELEKDRAQMLYVIQRSFNAVKPDIQRCLGKANAEEALEDFRNDLIPIDNEVLEDIKQMAKGIKESAKQHLDELQSKKETLDKKYED